MPRRAGTDDEIEEQPIALRSFIKAGHTPSYLRRFRRYHVMASRNQGLQLELDKTGVAGSPDSETVTPTPRAAKFSGFPGEDGATPTSVGSALTSEAASPSPQDALVEIKVRRRKPTEVERQAAVQGTSAFDDTPPAEVYDPSWNTLPFRCEAGQLRHGKNTAAKAPVLPGAFRMNTEHEDEEEEDTGTAVTRQRADKENDGAQNKQKATSPGGKKGGEGITERQRAALGRLFVKRKGGKDGGSPSSGSSPRIELKLKKANRNTIESSREAKAALHHLSVIMQCDYQAEIVAHKSSELRVKVPISVGGEMTPHLVVIGAAELSDKTGSKMTFRRSLTDISRISQEEFFTFCEDVSRRFKKLEGAIKTKGRK